MDYFNLTLEWWLTTDTGNPYKSNYNIFWFGWFNVFYISTEVSFITFASLFLIRRLISDIKIMYTIILVAVILCILFGGVLNTYFGFINDDAFAENIYHSFKRGSAWPKVFFYPMFLFPLFPIGQQLILIQGSVRGLVIHGNIIDQMFYINADQSLKEYFSHLQMFLIFIMPYIYVILFGIIGSLLKEK